MTDNSVLQVYHPQARERYAHCSNLEKVCKELQDPYLKLNQSVRKRNDNQRIAMIWSKAVLFLDDSTLSSFQAPARYKGSSKRFFEPPIQGSVLHWRKDWWWTYSNAFRSTHQAIHVVFTVRLATMMSLNNILITFIVVRRITLQCMAVSLMRTI